MIKIFFFLAALPLFAELSQPIQDFSFSFYHTLDPKENAVFSPFSIYTCLAMPYAGAKENTEEEMKSVLGLSPPDLTNSLSSYLSAISSKSENAKSYQLHVANGLWTSKDILILSNFRQTIEEDFHGAIQTLDFNKPKDASDTINAWISEHTQEKIPNLLTPSDITDETKLVLANAIYFQGSWLKAFDQRATRPRPFWKDQNTSIDLPMMEQTGYFSYYENNDLQLLSLPFVGREKEEAAIAFLILLPKKGKDFPQLSAPLFSQLLGNLGLQRVHIQCPKFTLNQRIDLNPTLASMGLSEAFTPQANFSGINGKKDLYFSKAVHQAFIDVDENGVTAAAATAIGMNATSAITTPPLEFIADHPFLFFIADLHAQIPLFIGTLCN